MSDNARRFAAVRTALINYHGKTPSKRMRRQLTTLAAMVAGTVAAGRVHLSSMAHKAPDHTHPESRVRRSPRVASAASRA